MGDTRMKEYLAMWKNYVNFTDRTTIRGYWMAVLFNFIAAIILTVIIALTKFQFLSYLYSLAGRLPGLGITVRRLRDAGRPWAWIFIALIPIIGDIWLIVLLCGSSKEDDGVPVV
jgi:uncharacterized membrane protein YhaH (DUF805 family)